MIALPEGPLPIAGYGAAAIPVEILEVSGNRSLQPRTTEQWAPSKGEWLQQEDELLKRLATEHGKCKWAEISKHLPGRIGKQCRERWTNHLHSDLKVCRERPCPIGMCRTPPSNTHFLSCHQRC
ncbi:hypothetical protein VPH35_015915 [Triticum aestivum]